jgi:outer membrane protein assembly factor BamB
VAITQKHWLKSLVCVGVWGLTALMSGCASDRPENAQAGVSKNELPVIEDKQVIASKTLWKNQPTGGAPDLQWPLQLTQFDGGMYVTSQAGQVAALSAQTGKPRWKVSVRAQVVTGAAVDAQHVFVGTHQGELIALDREKGQVLWATALSSVPMATPTVDGSSVYVHTNDNQVVSLNTTDGRVNWQHSEGSPPLKLHGMSPLTVTAEYVLVGTSDGKLQALNKKEGGVVWWTSMRHLSSLISVSLWRAIKESWQLCTWRRGKRCGVGMRQCINPCALAKIVCT